MHLEALREAKMLYFTGAEENAKPVNSLHAVAGGTMKAITYLRRQFATMALLPIFHQHGYSATLSVVELKQFSMILDT